MKKIIDRIEECGMSCPDGGKGCYSGSLVHLPERRAKATCRKCGCMACTRAKCYPAVTARLCKTAPEKPKDTPADPDKMERAMTLLKDTIDSFTADISLAGEPSEKYPKPTVKSLLEELGAMETSYVQRFNNAYDAVENALKGGK